MSADQLTVKTNLLPNSRIAVELEVDSERCKTCYEEALSRLSRSLKLPGFRKGKVPKAVILQQVGIARIQASALEKLLEGVWKEALEKESIEPLCEPELQGGFETLLESFSPEKKLIFTLETDIAPTPVLKTTKGLEAEVEKVIYDPQKVDELIEQSRKQLATLIPVEDRPAEKGDIAVVSFKGTYSDNGNEINGGSAESMDIELEEGRMIPGFIEGIIGMKISEEKIVKCEFPDNYPEKEAQGKKADFQITLNDLKTRELPELDDAFAQQTSDKKNLKELREDLEERLKKDTAIRYQKNRNDALLAALVSELEVDLPKTLIDQEVRNLIEETARNLAQQGIDVKSMFTNELVQSLMESSKEEAQENLRRTFALKALAQEEKIEVDDQELEEKLKEVRKDLSKEKNIDPNKLRQIILEDLLKDKLFKWLEENNTVTEKSTKDKNSKQKNHPPKPPS